MIEGSATLPNVPMLEGQGQSSLTRLEACVAAFTGGASSDG